MIVLGLDTATRATAVAVLGGAEVVARARHDPAAGERPGHATRLLGLVERALGDAGIGLDDVARIGVGVGPGSFTGLRIGISTARALAQAGGRELVGVSSLQALAHGCGRERSEPVAAVLDARHGEAFVAVWSRGRQLLAPAALSPAALGATVERLGPGVRAVGEGAIRFRDQLEAVGAAVASDDSALHSLDAGAICRVAAESPPGAPNTVVPDYIRLPDAEIARRARDE